MTSEQLQHIMDSCENERLEFKEAQSSFEFEHLVRYSVALANERGGRLILGVTDKHPRKIVGSQAFQDLERTKHSLTERLRLRIDVEAFQLPEGRVIVFQVPPRPIGMPIQHKGAYWMRSGESLVPMTPDQLKRIFEESGPDFSAEIANNATFADLDPIGITRFREMWKRKSGNSSLESATDAQLLTDAELLIDGAVTYGALILFGSRKSLGRYLAQSEVVFEYRSGEASVPFQQRQEFREGFFLFDDELWKTINLRNELQHYQEGLFVWDIQTFNEKVFREAILNAVSHRDYRLHGSVFVRQYPKKIEIVSPGGFPPGITPDNILDRQSPRNRRIAEVFARCGLVERSGQGVNRMFEECIKESKPRPDFSETDDYQVSLTLKGEVQNPQFLRFLEHVTQQGLGSFTTQDLLVLDSIQREDPVPHFLKDRLTSLKNRGILEITGRGRGTKPILSRRFYSFLGKKGVYTRKRGLDRETNKALLLQHIESYRKEGSRLQDLMQVLPQLTRDQVQKLLGQLKKEGRIHFKGKAIAVRWYPGSSHPEVAPNLNS
ncbi:MAG: ATP-binding protein [Nitrospirales bacterium]